MIFTVFGEPKGKGRPRFYNGHAVTPPATRLYERLIRESYKVADGKLEAGLYDITITAYYGIAKSVSKARHHDMLLDNIRPAKKPDLDNVVKAVLDALNGVAFPDDACVTDLHAFKRYAEVPRLVIEIKKIEGKYEK